MSSYIEWDMCHTDLLTDLHTFQLPGADHTTYGRNKKTKTDSHAMVRSSLRQVQGKTTNKS